VSIDDLSAHSIQSLSKWIQQGDISSQQLVESCIAKTVQHNPLLNAFAFFDADKAIDQAIELDKLRSNGRWLGPLHGIPIAVKDNYLVNGMPATACSATRDQQEGTRDATAIAKLKAAGALVFGKTNMHEWAYGATNKISREGSVKNPWDSQRISGGSSGGSAAALAAGLVPAAMGSDTGGSIRIPAAACGVCGLKPTFGNVSTDGVLPLAWSLDVAGPMARSVDDLSILFDAVKQKKNKHLTSDVVAKDSEIKADLLGLKVATLCGERLEHSDDVAEAFNLALDMMCEQGAEVNSVAIDNMVDGFSAWDTILHVEATTYHSETIENRAELFSDNVRNHLEAGRYIPAVNYLKAQQFRSLFNSMFAQIFIKNHIIVLPTLPVTAPLIESQDVEFGGVQVTPQDSMTYLAWLANFTCLPALSIPCGKGKDGMPVGMSLIGPAGSDRKLLQLGQAIQQMSSWHKEKPTLSNNI